MRNYDQYITKEGVDKCRMDTVVIKDDDCTR